VLDCCTGTADVAIAAAQAKSDSHVYGLDFSQNMLHQTRPKIERKQVGERMLLLQADALELPFSGESVDIIFLSFGLRNLLDRAQGLAEMTRVLKSHGQIAILEFAPPQQTVFGLLYRIYLGTIMPFIGQLISKSPSAYRYLHTSIEQFLPPEEMITLFHEHGLDVISVKGFQFGIAYLYIARKNTLDQKKDMRE
jgi:demethylmenaquinone methyltransferase/2-methoxy-6-polyprenyl-1,4-benzoquinol methylase